MSVSVLHDWVARASNLRPEAAALVHPEVALTYETLERESNRMARALREVGCSRGDRVAFLLPRCPMTIAVVVGILKADCIYVPLDLRSPATRLVEVLRQCEPIVVVAGPPTEGALSSVIREGGLQGALLGWMGRKEAARPSPGGKEGDEAVAAALRNVGFTWSHIESLSPEPPESRARPDDPAYILFTSGSTGTPKGVVITHRNVITFVEWAVEYFDLGPEDRLGGYTELTFDLSTFDIYATLAAGAQLHIVPDELKLLPPRVVDFIRRAELTHWLSVPSFLEYVARFDALQEPDLPTMRSVTWCGDVLPTSALGYWMVRLPHAGFVNLYGPTETTVASSYYRVPDRALDPHNPVPIGQACGGEELLLLDDELRPVTPGEVGRIHIRGSGLSPGYWRDPERTREVFLPDPSQPESAGRRVYSTGDLGRLDENGMVHFLGREDQQVKTRGYRVELGEVEHAVQSLSGISGCAVVGFTNSGTPGKLLGCAYVAVDGDASPRRVKDRLGELLPDYMIPVRWKQTDRLPLTDRGKVDRRRIQQWMEEAP